jgi:hypothetical protein
MAGSKSNVMLRLVDTGFLVQFEFAEIAGCSGGSARFPAGAFSIRPTGCLRLLDKLGKQLEASIASSADNSEENERRHNSEPLLKPEARPERASFDSRHQIAGESKAVAFSGQRAGEFAEAAEKTGFARLNDFELNLCAVQLLHF